MKKSLLLFISILLFAPIIVKAQDETKPNKLKGIWQLCEVKVDEKEDGKSEFAVARSLPTYKIMSETGEYTIFNIGDMGTREKPNFVTIITSVGTYDHVTDSIYHENIKENLNSSMVNTTVEVHYQMIDDKFIFTYHKVDNNEYLERWRKLEFSKTLPMFF